MFYSPGMHSGGNVAVCGEEAKVIVENWQQEYNPYEKDRLHSSLGYLTPAEFARQYYEKNQAEETTQPGARSNSRDSLIVSGTRNGGTPQ